MVFLLGTISTPSLYAQSIELKLDKEPLVEALGQLGIQYGIDFIYSVRLVEKHQVTCSYTGSNIDQAIACLLSDTNLRAKRLHDRQYILASAPPPPLIQGDARTINTTYDIRGIVREETTGRSLPGAHIYLPEIRRGTISTSTGTFSIPALSDSVYEARISYLGYRAVDTLLVAATNPTPIFLQPVALETRNILVEAQSDGPGAFSMPGLLSMNVEQLGNSAQFGGEKDLLQTLQRSPGVQKAGLFQNGLLVRGGFSDQNLYMLDGAPVYHPWHAFNLISTFNSDAFEEVKFYKGSFPAQHGGRLSSVLDARLKDGSRSGPTATLGMSVLSGRFLIESPLTKNSSFMISGRRSYIDKLIGTEHPVQDANGTRDTLRTGYHFSDITAKVGYKINEAHKVSFSYYSGQDILDLRLPFNLSLDFDSWLQPAELFFEVDHNWGNRLYTFQHQFIASPRFLVTNTLYRSSYNANEGEFVQPTSSSNLQSAYHVRVRDLGLKTELDYTPSDKHHIQLGTHLIDHQFDSSLDAIIHRSEGARDTLLQHSSMQAIEGVAYIQETWKPSSTWGIQPGLRLNYFSLGSHLSLNPRLSIYHIVDPRYLTIKGAISSQVQFIQQLRDRYSFMYDLSSSRWIPTGQDVEPSQSLQLAITGNSRLFSWLKLDVEGYWRSSQDVLLPRDVYQQKEGLEGPGIEVATLISQYTPGLTKAYGVEVTSQIDYHPWHMSISYSASRSLSKAPIIDNESFRPTTFDVPHFFRGSLTRTYSNWHITLSSLVRNGYPITVPVASYDLSGPGDVSPTQYLHRPVFNNGRLPAYVRFDVTVGFQFDMLGADWTTQLYFFNLTNRRNIVDRYFEPSQSEINVTNRKGLPFLPLLEIEMVL